MATASAPSAADRFQNALDTTEVKEASPSYQQLAKAMHQLADVALPGLTEEQHERLRTRTGVSALIDMLEKSGS